GRSLSNGFGSWWIQRCQCRRRARDLQKVASIQLLIFHVVSSTQVQLTPRCSRQIARAGAAFGRWGLQARATSVRKRSLSARTLACDDVAVRPIRLADAAPSSTGLLCGSLRRAPRLTR